MFIMDKMLLLQTILLVLINKLNQLFRNIYIRTAYVICLYLEPIKFLFRDLHGLVYVLSSRSTKKNYHKSRLAVLLTLLFCISDIICPYLTMCAKHGWISLRWTSQVTNNTGVPTNVTENYLRSKHMGRYEAWHWPCSHVYIHRAAKVVCRLQPVLLWVHVLAAKLN